jgi:hypothetical protein
MAYSQVGIANLALIRAGTKTITALTENIVVNAVWQYIRDEVLAAKDWKFAKTRVALAKNATAPVYQFDYAYTLPTDFLRLCRQDASDASVFPSGLYSEDQMTGQIYINSYYYPYKIEAISDGTLCLLSDYDNTDNDIYITYIQKITDVTKFSPAFINALANRLGAEIAISITESSNKFADLMNLYKETLKTAEALNSSSDFQDETGSDSWDLAGR